MASLIQGQETLPMALPTLLSRMHTSAAQGTHNDSKFSRSEGSKGSKGSKESRGSRTVSTTSFVELPTPTMDEDGEASPSQRTHGSPMCHLQTDFSPMYTYAHHQNAFCFAGACPMLAPAPMYAYVPLPLSLDLAAVVSNTLRAAAAAPYFTECVAATVFKPATQLLLLPQHAALEDPISNGVPDGDWTSLMIRNLPKGYNRSRIMDLLDVQGLAVHVNFIYLPTNLRNEDHFGYAFVNFTTHGEALNCIQQLDGFSNWPLSCANRCEVTWSLTFQGFHAHIERYRNSRIMHESVDDECKPAVFVNGVRAEFPAPSKSIRAPRFRKW